MSVTSDLNVLSVIRHFIAINVILFYHNLLEKYLMIRKVVTIVSFMSLASDLSVLNVISWFIAINIIGLSVL